MNMPVLPASGRYFPHVYSAQFEKIQEEIQQKQGPLELIHKDRLQGFNLTWLRNPFSCYTPVFLWSGGIYSQTLSQLFHEPKKISLFNDVSVTSFSSHENVLYVVGEYKDIFGAEYLSYGHCRERIVIDREGIASDSGGIRHIAANEHFIFVLTDNGIYAKEVKKTGGKFKIFSSNNDILQIEATSDYLFVLLPDGNLRVYPLVTSGYSSIGFDELYQSEGLIYRARFDVTSFAVNKDHIQFGHPGTETLPCMEIYDVVIDATTQTTLAQLLRQIMNYEFLSGYTDYQRQCFTNFLNILRPENVNGIKEELNRLMNDKVFINKPYFRPSKTLKWVNEVKQCLEGLHSESLKTVLVILAQEGLLREQSALNIQACYRGYSVRKQLARLKEDVLQKSREEAAGKIQAFYRGYSVRKQLARLREEAAVKIQSRYRGNSVRKQLPSLRAEAVQRSKEEEAKILAQQQHEKHEQSKNFHTHRDSEEFSLPKGYLGNDDL